MQADEGRLLELRRTEAKDDLSRTKLVLIAGTLLGLLITGAAGFIVQRDGSKRGLAEQALRDAERTVFKGKNAATIAATVTSITSMTRRPIGRASVVTRR